MPNPPPGERPRGPIVEIVPALSNVAWSPAMVGQYLEALMVYLGPGGPRFLRPIHAATLRTGWRPDQQPGEMALAAVTRYGLRPLLVHSTSWRQDEGHVILTYVVAVAQPEVLNENLTEEPVRRADLARGDALGPPARIEVAEVLEHAFRHLAWLVNDDDAVRDALPDWVTFLAAYEPEPFRAFAPPA